MAHSYGVWCCCHCRLSQNQTSHAASFIYSSWFNWIESLTSSDDLLTFTLMLVTIPKLFIWLVCTLELVGCALEIPLRFYFSLFSLVIGFIIVIFAALSLFELLLLCLDITMLQLLELTWIIGPSSCTRLIFSNQFIDLQILLNNLTFLNNLLFRCLV